MSGSALFHIAFIAVVVLILVTVWAALVLEAGEDPPGRQPPARGAGHRQAITARKEPHRDQHAVHRRATSAPGRDH